MRSLVIDAGVAIKWLNPAEPLADKANAIRDTYEQGQITLLVPIFWDYEIVNTVNKAVAQGDLAEEEGREAISLLLTIHAHRIPHPSPHASYALAEEMGSEFWTDDLKLYNAVKDRLPFVKWLGSYAA